MDEVKQNTPITENEHVSALLTLMSENRVANAQLETMLRHVAGLEQHLDEALGQLTEMRGELAEMRRQREHPVASAMESAAATLDERIGTARYKLLDVKDSIIKGCHDAVAAFREKGVSALYNLAEFFKIKTVYQHLGASLRNAISGTVDAQARIAAASEMWHKAGQDISGVGRALAGKEAPDIRPMGAPAKAVESAIQGWQDTLVRALKSMNNIIAKLDDLERAAEKPSVPETMQTLKVKVVQVNKDAPVKPIRRDPEL